MYYRILISIVIVLFIGGCGSMPNLQVGYYLPRSELEVVVTQTGTCSSNDIPIVTTDVKFNASFSSNTVARKELDLKELGGIFTKADATLEFYSDRRLKSINGAQTGQGSEALKSIVSLADNIIDYKGAQIQIAANKVKAACAEIRSFVDPKKPLTPLTIVHRGYITSPKKDAMDEPVALEPTTLSKGDFAKVADVFGIPVAEYSINIPIEGIHHVGKNNGQGVFVVEPAVADLKVTLVSATRSQIYSGKALVPQHGLAYQLPLQKPPLFGKNEFEIILEESGYVSKLKYSGDRDVAGMVEVVSKAYEPFDDKEKTMADQAANTKAEADLIFQQQRLIQCKADPANCPK